MKNIKHTIALMLSLLMLLSVFLVSCNKNKGMGEESSSDTASEIKEATPVLISDQGTAKFSIVYDSSLATDVLDSVRNLYSALKKRSGDNWTKIETANVKNYDVNACEILIGDTGYPESKEVMDSLGYGEWTVRFCGNKLVVAGFSRNGLNSAITEVIKQIKNGASDDGTITIAGDLNISNTEISVLNNLPRFEEAYPQTASQGGDTGLAVISGMTVDTYGAYLTKLSNAGYNLYTSNIIGNNTFSTYENGEYMIHAGYYAYESAARVTIEKKTSLVELESENVWTADPNVVSSLAQVGIAEASETGMAYIYQLADGSFIVIDGGFMDDAEVLYDYMREKAPGDEIVIAAWLITHDDIDHREAFQTFVPAYRNDVKIERVIMNIPNGTREYSDGGVTLTIANQIPDCRVIKAHTGQKFYIRNAVVEIIFTIDGLFPEPLEIFNNSSMVFTVDVEGERALFAGDISDEVAKILNSMYGDALKSDIFQMPHHGIRNGHGLNMPNVVKLCSLVKAEILLIPCTHENWLNKEQDKSLQMQLFEWNIEALKWARECYIASDYTEVLELPYAVYSAYKFVPGETREPVCADRPSSEDSLTCFLKVGETVINKVNWND
jgi:predicted small secreted protein